jgi:hypothetical protein
MEHPACFDKSITVTEAIFSIFELKPLLCPTSSFLDGAAFLLLLHLSVCSKQCGAGWYYETFSSQ